LIFFSFHWENGSIINSFHTVAPTSLKPSRCTHTHWVLSENTKSPEWSAMDPEILAWETRGGRMI
jgi:hypothetical protein